MTWDASTFAGALRHAGFTMVDRRGDTWHASRRVGQRDDHVQLRLASRGVIDMVLRRQRAVTSVQVGQVFRLVPAAFHRDVPDQPQVPDEVHVAADLADLVSDGNDAPAAVAAIVTWTDLAPTAGHVLADGRISDPMLRLEFAVVARDRDAGERAAIQARDALHLVRPARRSMVEARIDVALQRLR